MALTFIHVTDTHLDASPDALTCFYSPAAALTATLEHIARHHAHDAAFIIHTGDMPRNSGVPEGYDCGKAVYGFADRSAAPGPLTVTAAGLNLPLYYVPGNADDRVQCLARLFADEFDPPLFNFTWRQNGVRLLTLDWGAWKTDRYTLTPQTFDWLGEQLKDDQPTVIFTHHPPVPVASKFFDRMLPDDMSRLHELLAGSSVIAIFHGHTHHPWHHHIGAIPVFGTGSITWRVSLFDPSHREIADPQYRLVTIHDDNTVTVQLHHVPAS